MKYEEILKEAFDLHVHIGPEIIPRKFTLSELLKHERGKLKGIGVKNHFFPTISMDQIAFSKDYPFVVNSVVLNHYMGGFNSDIIRASAELFERPIIVWFPTLHTKKFIGSQDLEIPKEWIDQRFIEKIKLRRASEINALLILDNQGQIKDDVRAVLEIIKEYDAILATGHLSWEESLFLVQFAKKSIGIERIIITHPIYQKINMPVRVQKELAGLGTFIEHCYSMHSIDKVPVEKIVKQIKEVGAESCILSSDVGQAFSPSPSEALTDFIFLLEKDGISEKEIETMLIKNPSVLLN